FIPDRSGLAAVSRIATRLPPLYPGRAGDIGRKGGVEGSGGPSRPFGSADARLDRLGDRARKEEPPAALGSVAGDLPGNQDMDPNGSEYLAQCQHLSDRLRPILIRG